VKHLGRRFALGDLMRGFARTVGRTWGLSVAVRGWLAKMLRELGPLAAIALLLPGGSLIALAAWAFRHRPLVTAPLGRLSLVVAVFAAALILPGNI
jgi:hypothetical protein